MTRVQAFPYRSNAAWMLASSSKAFHSRAGKALYWQWSPRNGSVHRFFFQKWMLGLMRLTAFRFELPPVANRQWVGIVKRAKSIVFELDGERAVAVWKRGNGEWQREAMLGYPLIEAYTPEHLHFALPTVAKALHTHWVALLEDSTPVHGDLTHFNILSDEHGRLNFIDAKPGEDNLLFDLFYFRSYLTQALERCTTLDAAVCQGFLAELDSVIAACLRMLEPMRLHSELQRLKAPKNSGLSDAQRALLRFKQMVDEAVADYSATNGGTSSGAVR
jgi:hypothetical protein